MVGCPKNIYMDLDLNHNNLINVSAIDLSVSANDPVYQEGRLFYDEAADAVSYYTSEPEVKLQIGQESWIRVRNNSGATILNGKAVYITGSIGQNPTISLARSDSPTTASYIGLATHDIENNSVGFITIVGVVNGLSTATLAEGTFLYLSETTAGEWTSTKPSGGNLIIPVGVVTNSHGTNGSILVNPGSNGNISLSGSNEDVSISSTPPNGYVLTWNDTTKLWEPAVGATGGGGGDVTGPGTAIDSGIVLFDGTTGKLIKDSGITTIGDVSGPGSSIANGLAVYDGATGKLLKTVTASADGAGSLLVPGSVSATNFGIFDGGITVANLGAAIDLNLGNITDVATLHAIEVSAQSNQNDDVSLLTLNQDGLNPGKSNFFAGDRSPEGNVIGTGGDFYFRANGSNSTLYVFSGIDGNTTGWNDLNSAPGSGGDVSGPGTATDSGFVQFDGTTGKLIKDSTVTSIGDVTGPATATSGNVVLFDGTTGKLLLDSGKSVIGDVSGPGAATANGFAQFDGTTGKLIKDSTVTSIGDVTGPAAAVDGGFALFDGTTGKLVKDGGVISIGNVSGPGSSLATQLAVFSDATGKLIKTVTVSADALGSILAPGSVSATNFGFFNAGVSIGNLGANLSMNFGDITKVATVHAIEVSAESNLGTSASLITLNRSAGTDGAIASIFVGSATPEGSVSGTEGDVYFRADGANSTVYVFRGTDNTSTGWNDLNEKYVRDKTLSLAILSIDSTALDTEDVFVVDTQGGAIILTLEANPLQGRIIDIRNIDTTAGINDVTVSPNGNNIDDSASDLILATNTTVRMAYDEGAISWYVVGN